VWWPWSIVVAAIGWNLVSLRALTLSVAYSDDSSVHEQMVRFATARLRAGHLPLTSWFPFLGEGSPQFLHYQSLPAIVTGLSGLAVGPGVAFRWSLYLLLSLWPVSVYLSARAFGAGRPAAAASAAMAPFLVSATGVGYEQQAYVWTGFGVWTQLWASWTLPLAWGWSWRAIRDGCGFLGAILLTALTVALHFETGYLALSVLLCWPFVAGQPLAARLRRGAVLLGGSLLAAAWVIVPLVAQRQWAAVNEPLQGSGLVNGYGARSVLDWLVSGQLLDQGRLPVVTVFAALGLGLAWLAWSSDTNARALLVALAGCLLLAFGRTTFGSLVDVIPGGADLFFRRFMMGVQLAALLLAGRGAAWLAARCVRLFKARVPRWPSGLYPAAVFVTAVVVLAPGWLQLGAYDRHDGAAIAAQRRADHTEGADVDRLVAVIERDGGGRTYAGMPSNWGQDFAVGTVPVFKYLESRDVDEVGYTLRTASLMTGPEYFFDDRDPADYRLFGIRFLILPARDQPPVRARLAMRSGPYWLWTIDGGGYVQVGQVVGELSANRTNLGARNARLLASGLAGDGAYLGVRYGAVGGETGRLPSVAGLSSAGEVSSERADLDDGEASATVRMSRPGIVVLSASYDPGWTATVNGQRRPTRMVAPALVAVDVPAGTDRVVFRFHGYGDYPELFALSGLALALAAVAPVCLRRRELAAGRRLRVGLRLDGPARRRDSRIGAADHPAVGQSEHEDRLLPELGTQRDGLGLGPADHRGAGLNMRPRRVSAVRRPPGHAAPFEFGRKPGPGQGVRGGRGDPPARVMRGQHVDRAALRIRVLARGAGDRRGPDPDHAAGRLYPHHGTDVSVPDAHCSAGLLDADHVAGRVAHGEVADAPGLADRLLQHLDAGRARDLAEHRVEVVAAELDHRQRALGEQGRERVAILLGTARMRLREHDLDLGLAVINQDDPAEALARDLVADRHAENVAVEGESGRRVVDGDVHAAE
jgi:Bacterial membrane protein YfhO